MDNSIYLRPNEDWWCVVSRHVRDTRSRGIVLYFGLEQEKALRIVRSLNDYHGDLHNYNYWAVKESEY